MGTIVSALMYSQRFRSLVRSIADTYQGILISLVSAGRVQNYFNETAHTDHIPVHYPCYTVKNASSKRLVLTNVYFAYRTPRYILQNFSYTFESPGVYLIKGKNGCGKTTLLHILSRQFCGEVYSGNIEMYGFEEKVPALVSQNPFIFSASIRDNITFAHPVDEDMFQSILKKTHLADAVAVLPEKERTVLGKEFHVLSAGQKQRLALARCLLHNSEIILFDEIENALDHESDKALQDILSDLKRTTLVIMVTHRNTYDAIAKDIVVL